MGTTDLQHHHVHRVCQNSFSIKHAAQQLVHESMAHLPVHQACVLPRDRQQPHVIRLIRAVGEG